MPFDFRLEVAIWLFCACTVKNMQYNSYYILLEQFDHCGLAMGFISRFTERISGKFIIL